MNNLDILELVPIDTEMIDQLTQPFFQVEHDLNRSYDGAGLGLAIVCEIVKLYQGQLKIDDRL